MADLLIYDLLLEEDIGAEILNVYEIGPVTGTIASADAYLQIFNIQVEGTSIFEGQPPAKYCLLVGGVKTLVPLDFYYWNGSVPLPMCDPSYPTPNVTYP